MPTKTRPGIAAVPPSDEPAGPIKTLEDGHVQATLKDGSTLVFREPKVKQFLLIESWLKDDKNEYHADTAAVLKMAHLCLVGDDRTFDEFLDELDIQDLEVLGQALSTFRSVFEFLATKSGAAV
jgi:hypothetical protein